MASAKFLEEALSTDVDESAVNAIVGSLETQLVTSTPVVTIQQPTTVVVSQNNNQLNSVLSNGGNNIPIVHGTIQKHGVANGGNNCIINQSDINKSTVTTNNILPVNIVTSSSTQPSTLTSVVQSGSSIVQAPSAQSLASTLVQQQQQQQQQQLQNQSQGQQQKQQIINTTTKQQIQTFLNQQVTNNNQQQQQQNIITNKNNDTVKLIYPTSGIVNVNNKIQFTNQNIGQLGNGSLGVVTTQTTVLQTTSNVSTTNTVGTLTQSVGGQTITTNVNKPTGTSAIVLKTSGIQGGMVSVPMSVPVSVAGNTANATLQGKQVGGVGGQTMVPGNVQILNVNQIRPATPTSGQQAGKQLTSRVILGPQLINSRPGGPAITLHGLQSGAQGHLIVKTENGQYQLLRVGPPQQQTPGTPGSNAVTSNTISGNAVVGQSPGTTTTYRLASVPGVSRVNTQFTGPPLATIRKPVQTVAPIVATTTVTPTTATAPAPTIVTPTATTSQSPQTPAQRQTTTENTKEKCRKFLANLLELSSREPRSVERNVRTLIQELIDTEVEPEEFCDRLERLLNASPQPCLIGFLKKSLPLLRQSLVKKELVIEGIRPPPANVVFSIATTPSTIQQNQVRTTMAVPSSVPYVVSSAQIPGRVMPPPIATAAPTINTPRPQQSMHHQRMIRPTTIVRSPAPFTVKSANAASIVRPTMPVVQKTPITTSTPVMKTITTTSVQGKIVNAATTINKTIVPSLVPKPAAKEKEKKTFSSAGCTGDDDINDVAAMGGVNLAEESQRILGSTEFVGTQIRSCKDEVFLHVSQLQQKIKQIVCSHGLEEPNQEVAALISHATQERLKNLVEKLAVIAEHRTIPIKNDSKYEITQDVKRQLKFLEDLDRVERKKHEEQEREILLRAAKSRSRVEDPEQVKLKALAKEMQRQEMEELRQKDANSTALLAIGTRKKMKLDDGNSSSTGTGSNSMATGLNRKVPPPRLRVKRVNFRDLLFLLEQEKETCRSTMLYKGYLK